MFTSLHITNFKCLSDLPIKPLTPITLIGGKNNVGKTSLLEALFLFYDRLNPQMFVRQLAWRGTESVAMTRDEMWAPFFSDYQISNPIQIELTDQTRNTYSISFTLDTTFRPDRARELRTLNTAAIKPEQSDSSASGPASLRILVKRNKNVIQDAHLMIGPAQLGLHITSAQQVDQSAVFLSARAAVPHNDEAERLGRLDVHRKVRPLVDTLKEIEPRLKSLSMVQVANTNMIHADIEGLPRKIPLGYVGHGFSRLTSIALAIHASPHGAVFVDEIENGLHHSVLPDIWKIVARAAKENDCQVFATTHSYECLQAAHQAFSKVTDGEFSYFRLDRTGKGIVGVPYTGEELGTALASEWEVR